MPDPQAFARSWLDAWNRHDISAVLAHFADDATFASPLAMRIVEGSDGRIRGKRALRDYWAEALR
jgi:ketosteroid isomerase-like protein